MQLLDVSISEAFHEADKEPTDAMLASTDRIEKEIEENKPSRGKLTFNCLLCYKTTETARKPRMFGTRTKDTKSLIKARLKHPIVSNVATEMSRTLGEKEKKLSIEKERKPLQNTYQGSLNLWQLIFIQWIVPIMREPLPQEVGKASNEAVTTLRGYQFFASYPLMNEKQPHRRCLWSQKASTNVSLSETRRRRSSRMEI
jgi:hypothetical protein